MGDGQVGPGRQSGEGLGVLISLHQGGGAGSVNSVLHLALGLQRRGALVRFLCPPDSPVEQAARDGGLEVHPLQLVSGSRFANARRLAEVLARHPVDLINSQGARDREAFGWLGLRGRLPAPLVLTRRSYPRSTRLENWLAGRAATKVIAVSNSVAEILGAKGIPRRKIVVVPNGLMTERIDRPFSGQEMADWRERIEWTPEWRTVGIVARPKDQWVVLEALESVRTPIRLVMAGLDGAALTAPLPPIPERHLVVRLPFIPAIRPLYELLEVVLHPSRWDALPQAVLEAMALGKPVIASDASGNAELITSGVDGVLVPPTDPLKWAEALDRVLNDPELGRRLAAAAVRRARDDFAFDLMLDRTLSVYRAVLDAKP